MCYAVSTTSRVSTYAKQKALLSWSSCAKEGREKKHKCIMYQVAMGAIEIIGWVGVRGCWGHGAVMFLVR